MKQVLTGVPQGSIIGLLLFNILINHIVKACDKFDFILYADDTTLNSTLDCFGKNTDEIKTQSHMSCKKFFKWFDVNKIKIYVISYAPKKYSSIIIQYQWIK